MPDPLVQDYAAQLPELRRKGGVRGRGEPDPERLRVLVRLLVNWLENVTLVREHSAEPAGAA